MASIYDDEKVKRYIEEVRNYYLNLTLEELQLIYQDINLDSLDWFYAKNTSFKNIKEYTNELYCIQYEICENTKKLPLLDVLNSGIDCSGLQDFKQIIYFAGNNKDHLNYFMSTLEIKEYSLIFKIDKTLKTVLELISVSKSIKYGEDIILKIGIAGDNAERSSIEMNYFVNNTKIKTVTSSNDELFFNRFRHKLDTSYFYEYKDQYLLRIYFIGKDSNEVNVYLNKHLK